jgi:hypothetical protein
MPTVQPRAVPDSTQRGLSRKRIASVSPVNCLELPSSFASFIQPVLRLQELGGPSTTGDIGGESGAAKRRKPTYHRRSVATILFKPVITSEEQELFAQILPQHRRGKSFDYKAVRDHWNVIVARSIAQNAGCMLSFKYLGHIRKYAQYLSKQMHLRDARWLGRTVLSSELGASVQQRVQRDLEQPPQQQQLGSCAATQQRQIAGQQQCGQFAEQQHGQFAMQQQQQQQHRQFAGQPAQQEHVQFAGQQQQQGQVAVQLGNLPPSQQLGHGSLQQQQQEQLLRHLQQLTQVPQHSAPTRPVALQHQLTYGLQPAPLCAMQQAAFGLPAFRVQQAFQHTVQPTPTGWSSHQLGPLFLRQQHSQQAAGGAAPRVFNFAAGAAGQQGKPGGGNPGGRGTSKTCPHCKLPWRVVHRRKEACKFAGDPQLPQLQQQYALALQLGTVDDYLQELLKLI